MQILSPKYEELRKSIEIQSIINCFPTLSLGAKTFRSMCTSRSDFESVRILSSRRKRKPSLHMPLQIIIQYFLITYYISTYIREGKYLISNFLSNVCLVLLQIQNSFGRIQIVLDMSNLVWTGPNVLDRVQNTGGRAIR